MGNALSPPDGGDELGRVQLWQTAPPGVQTAMELDANSVHFCKQLHPAGTDAARAFERLATDGNAITPRPRQAIENGLLAAGTTDKLLFVRRVTKPDDAGKLYFATHRAAVSGCAPRPMLSYQPPLSHRPSPMLMLALCVIEFSLLCTAWNESARGQVGARRCGRHNRGEPCDDCSVATYPIAAAEEASGAC